MQLFCISNYQILSNSFMKRKLFLLLTWVLFYGYGFTQTGSVNQTNRSITGLVKTKEGKPVSFASIILKTDNTVKNSIADSLGHFKVMVQSGNSITVRAVGYKDAMVKIDKQDSLLIVMNTDVNKLNDVSVTASSAPALATGQTSIADQQIIASTLNDFKMGENFSTSNSVIEHAGLKSSLDNVHYNVKLPTSNFYMGSAIPVFSRKEDTKGSRYMFDKWVKGSVLTAQNVLFNNDKYVFNYDKVAKNLIAIQAQDKNVMIELDKQNIKSFSLMEDNVTIDFEKVPLISSQNFQIVLVKAGGKYALYKSITTKFTKANYVSNGLVEHGNNYDEFIDQETYFVILPNNVLRTVDLKKKSIKNTFFEEGDKVEKYISKHWDDSINEIFLTDLVYYLNQK
jgi:hypothetical protein